MFTIKQFVNDELVKFFPWQQNNAKNEVTLEQNTHPIQADKLYYLGIKISNIDIRADIKTILQQVEKNHFTKNSEEVFTATIFRKLHASKEEAFASLAGNSNRGYSAVIAVQLADDDTELKESVLHLKSDKVYSNGSVISSIPGHAILTGEVATLFFMSEGKIHFVNNSQFQDRYPTEKYTPVAAFNF